MTNLVLRCSDRLLASDPEQLIDGRVETESEEYSLVSGDGHPHKRVLPVLVVELETGHSLSVANLPAPHASQGILTALLQTKALR